MELIRFWKAEEKGGAWRVVEDTPEALTAVRNNHTVRHMTVLAVSSKDPTSVPQESLRYLGDMYFDIDCKPEEVDGTLDDAIAEATKSCQELVRKLEDQGAAGLRIYASGSKGYHVILPKENFGIRKPQAFLFDTYYEMARQFYVKWLDMGIYSGKKGRMFREPNIERPNGKFKVELSKAELESMTPDAYQTYTSTARGPQPEVKAKRSDTLAGVFKMCQEAGHVTRKAKSELATALPSEDLQRIHAEGLPGCIDRLITHGDERDGSTFNHAALNLVTYIKDAGLGNTERDVLIRRMAASVKSSAFPEEKDRHRAISDLYQNIKESEYHFSKGALFKTTLKCGDCPICKASRQGDTGLMIDDGIGVAVSSTGYGQRFGEKSHPATNFLLSVVSVKSYYPISWGSVPNLDPRMRVNSGLVLEMTVYDSLGASDPVRVSLSEEAVNNAVLARDMLIRAGGAWLVAPDFWNRLKVILTDRGNLKIMNSENITTVPFFGVAVFTRKGEEVVVFCDPDNHLCSDPEIDEVFRTELQDDPKGRKLEIARARMPNLKALPSYSAKMQGKARGFTPEALTEMIRNLASSIPPAEAATVIGWFAACHLKMHLKAIGYNFPLLNMYGQPESGKTATAKIMLCLHGVYSTSDAPLLDCTQSTVVSLREKLTQSVSVPSIMDEFNQSMERNKYSELVSMMKSSYDQSATSKMSADGMKDSVLTSPIVACGEQPIGGQHRSLRTRSLEVAFSLSWKNDAERRKAFRKTNSSMKSLAAFGLDLIVEAVEHVPVEWVAETFEEALEVAPLAAGSDRKQEGYAACLTGLKFMEQCAKRLGSDIYAIVYELKSQLVESAALTEGASIDSDIDRIMRRIVTAIYQTECGQLTEREAVNPNFGNKRGGDLVFVARGIYAHLKQYSSERDVFQMSVDDFERVLKEAPPQYVKDLRGVPGAYRMSVRHATDRGWWGDGAGLVVEDYNDLVM